MIRAARQRLLLIGDDDRQLQAAVAQAMPGTAIHHAPNVFDGLAQLSEERFGAVLAAVEPVGRRPEAAVKTLRSLAGDSRLILFGDASHEPVSQRMLNFGCDDYLVTPVTPGQIKQVLSNNVMSEPEPPLRLHTDYDAPRPAQPRPAEIAPKPAPTAIPPADLSGLPARARSESVRPAAPVSGNFHLGEILLEAILEHPGDAIGYSITQFNARLGHMTGIQFSYLAAGTRPMTMTSPDRVDLSKVIEGPNGMIGTLMLQAPSAQEGIGRIILDELAPLLARAAQIQLRHAKLQKFAFTDELTGLFNKRYFNHFLARTLAEARKSRFPVTLFLFDIDNFKSYNDRFGHACGDDILKQTSNLMRRCVRDHDLVARIGGDEFAVIFWEKDGPRTPRDSSVGVPGRPPSEPEQILARFRRSLQSQSFPLLGPSGQGTLTISGGLAVFPYDACDLPTLVDAADKALMFGAKRSGRNSIHLVGGDKPVLG